MIQSISDKQNRERQRVQNLMALLCDYARYDGEPKQPIIELKSKITPASIRKFGGSIAVMAVGAFNEIPLAPTAHQRLAMRLLLLKVTAFWPNKPTPRTDQTPFNQTDLEKAVAQEIERAA